MSLLKQSTFLTGAFFYIIFCPVAFITSAVYAGGLAASGNHPDATLVNEQLVYDMEFWFFNKAAKGSMALTKDQKGYKATFTAETSGLVKAIAGHRVETIESIMEYDDTKCKFRPLSFQEQFSHGGREVKKCLLFDYEHQYYTYIVERNRKRISSMKKKLPAKEFDDLLTFFYNFRLGYYGEVTAGKKYSICVLVKERPSYITVDCNRPESTKKDADALYAVLSMDKDLTQARSRKITGLFSQDMVPLSGVVKDAYFFGDLSVKLRQRIRTRESSEKQEIVSGQTKQPDNATK